MRQQPRAQGFLLPGKYGWSLDPLLQYLDKVAAKEDLGIDLSTLRIQDQDILFEGSYSIESPNGTVTFYMQGGRLVAIAFADDVCLLAEDMEGAQTLMNAAQEYYVAASATLCAPKSIYTSNHKQQSWEIVLTLPAGAHDEREKVMDLCRNWRNQRATETGWRQNMPHNAVQAGRTPGTVKIQSDWLFLQQLGDSVKWLHASVAPLDYASSLLHHLTLSDISIAYKVLHRPLHLVNPKSGGREYLKWVEPTASFRYLGIQLSASLNWDAEYKYLLDQLNPILRQIKLGRKLGLAWDVFVQAASAKVLGLVSYHVTVVPFSPDRMATLNNKITEAFKVTAAASPHQMRCPQPIGLGIPDMTLRAAQTRIQLALTTLHSNNMEGHALRWCLRAIQLRSASGCFPWEDTTFWCPPAVQGFVEAVSQSLQQVDLRIRTVSSLFRPCRASPTPTFEQGVRLETPLWMRRLIQQYMHNRKLSSGTSLHHLDCHRRALSSLGAGPYLLDVPRGELPPLTRTELWTDKVVPRSAVQLPANVSISDGTGNGVVGMCQISDASIYALLSRIHAGDTSVEAELAGLIRSLESLMARASEGHRLIRGVSTATVRLRFGFCSKLVMLHLIPC